MNSEIHSRLVSDILKLHSREVIHAKSGNRLVCSHCSTGDPFCTVSDEWPCPTVAIVLDAEPLPEFA
jgi:hypothetical protein